MCSIYGAVGRYVDYGILEKIKERAKDRGRDGGNSQGWFLSTGYQAILGNWRATPTPETESAPFQPYDGLVHNGCVANTEELGVVDGEVDSWALARCLDRTHISSMVGSLNRVKGSYALACHNDETVFLACNYKPVFYWSPDSQSYYFSSMARHFVDVLPRGQSPTQVKPYSCLDLITGETQDIPRTDSKRVLVVCSGGLDSVTVAYLLKSQGYEVTLLHYLYGCRAQNKEVERVAKIAKDLETSVVFIKLPTIASFATSSLLAEKDTISSSVAGAEYAHEWVPARNVVFAALAIAHAESHGFNAVAVGTNLEESSAYPDNEEIMTTLLDNACPYFVQNGYSMRVLAPLGNLMKHEIVKLGVSLAVPYEWTWSCYREGATHCGNCGPCFMRKEAFRRNKLLDPCF